MSQMQHNLEQPIMISQQDFDRLEDKIDKMAVALTALILVEERQTNQGVRIGGAETNIGILQAQFTSMDKKLDRWINMGIGVWGVLLVLFALFKQFFSGH